MNLTSYSQNFEDIMLWRALKHIPNGFYIDVGANDPTLDSVTKVFYDHGWSGINIEPVSYHYNDLLKERSRDINLQCATGSRQGEIELYEYDVRGWATAETGVAASRSANGYEAKSNKVQVIPLSDICSTYVNDEIHFLKIDVEGLEKSVIDGMNFFLFRPWILVIEAVSPNSSEENHEEWEPLLLEANYQFAYADGLNRFYVAGEHSELLPAFKYPPNVFDGFLPSQQKEAQERAALAEARADQAEHQLNDLLESTSWKVTAPLRWLVLKYQSIKQANIKLLSKQIVQHGIRYINQKPQLKNTILQMLYRSPGLHRVTRRLLTSIRSNPVHNIESIVVADLVDVSVVQDSINQLVLPLPVGNRTIYVYVDHTVRCPTNTGVQRVVRGIAKSLLEAGEKVLFVKWHTETQQCVLIDMREREHLAKWNGPTVVEHEEIYPPSDTPQTPVPLHPKGENNWLVVPEVTHITYQNQPVTLDVLMWSQRAGLQSGFVFYDAIPLRRSEFKEISYKHAEYMQHLLLADVIWPISDWSSEDIKAFWAVNQLANEKTMPRVETLSLPGESLIYARATESQTTETLILCVGTIEPRKNQIQLIRAFQALRQRNLAANWRLILVGNLHPDVTDEVIAAIRKENAIQHLGHVSDQNLYDLYRSCAFTVFPSLEEGFGLPILESLWFGKPCLCANFGAMSEVAQGGGCLMVDTTIQGNIESGIEQLIYDTELRKRLTQQALSRPIHSWRYYAGRLTANFDSTGNPTNQIGLVYYWVDGTLHFPKNTGIQRVTRQLARALIENGIKLIPVKYDNKKRKLTPLKTEELNFLSQWNGPPKSSWHEWQSPEAAGDKAWFFMPELPLNQPTSERLKVITDSHTWGLRTAAIFYDAIPWKMRSIYPHQFSTSHREYMLELAKYDLVLAISAYSREDLVDFLGAELARPQSLDGRVISVQLPGEFTESIRETEAATKNLDAVVSILSVGTIEPRKNHEMLLRALIKARQKSGLDLRLILAGGSYSIEPALAERVRAFITSHSGIISWEEDADDTRLRQLYKQCHFSVYPSVEEGFGLPILESLWYGRPCICAGFGAMAEISVDGGCLAIDIRDEDVLADAICQLATDQKLHHKLTGEAVNRQFKSWHDYGLEISLRLQQLQTRSSYPATLSPPIADIERVKSMSLLPRPKLSVCISTYNRDKWLAVSLRNWSEQHPEPIPGVELVVCDNTSTDNTPQVVEPYLKRRDFRYKRNPRNVGMLGNLRETAHFANGEYIWIIGDDDLLLPDSVQRVINALYKNPGIALIYLNYAYTREDNPDKVQDLKVFFADATPIVPKTEDKLGAIHSICAYNENFFTAIYTLVLRRDHALHAYSQNTGGRPFSTMLTCIPTTYYALHNMMDETGFWIGSPQLVVNLNVSWLRYAPLWVLERIPEIYELAERCGVTFEEMDRWRRHTLPGAVHYFQEIFNDDPLGNAQYFSAARFVRRFKHLPEFKKALPIMLETYSKAHEQGHPAAVKSPSRVFPQNI